MRTKLLILLFGLYFAFLNGSSILAAANQDEFKFVTKAKEKITPIRQELAIADSDPARFIAQYQNYQNTFKEAKAELDKRAQDHFGKWNRNIQKVRDKIDELNRQRAPASDYRAVPKMPFDIITNEVLWKPGGDVANEREALYAEDNPQKAYDYFNNSLIDIEKKIKSRTENLKQFEKEMAALEGELAAAYAKAQASGGYGAAAAGGGYGAAAAGGGHEAAAAEDPTQRDFTGVQTALQQIITAIAPDNALQQDIRNNEAGQEYQKLQKKLEETKGRYVMLPANRRMDLSGLEYQASRLPEIYAQYKAEATPPSHAEIQAAQAQKQ